MAKTRPPRPTGGRETNWQHRLAIVPDTLLEQKLKVAAVNRQPTLAPMLKVTGSVVVRLAHSAGQDAKVEGRWDFSVLELAMPMPTG